MSANGTKEFRKMSGKSKNSLHWQMTQVEKENTLDPNIINAEDLEEDELIEESRTIINDDQSEIYFDLQDKNTDQNEQIKNESDKEIKENNIEESKKSEELELKSNVESNVDAKTQNEPSTQITLNLKQKESSKKIQAKPQTIKAAEKPTVSAPKPILAKNRNQSSDRAMPTKPAINMEMFNPTANKTKSGPMIVLNSAIRPKQTTLQKTAQNQSAKKSVSKIPPVPSRLDSSRIENNKRQQIYKDISEMRSEKAETPKKNAEKSSSSLSTVSEVLPSRTISAVSDRPLGQPSQPLILEMFADYPQPYSFIDQIQNEENLINRRNKARKQKKNVRSRTTSAKRALNPTSAVNKQPKTAGNKKMSKAVKENLIIVNAANEANAEKHETEEKASFVEDKGFSSDEDFSLKNSMSKSEAGFKTQRSLDHSHNKSDLVQSVADKVDAIYKKYNELITKQENRMERGSEMAKELSEQKAHFSEELAQELKVNFDELTSNPELAQKLRNVYQLVKENTSSQIEPPKVKPRQSESLRAESAVAEREPRVARSESLRADTNWRNSIRSNADIREIFSIVSGVSRNESFVDPAELTFPPTSRPAQNTQNSRPYKIPTALSEKINTLILPFQKNSFGDSRPSFHKTDDSKTLKNFKPRYNFVRIQIILQFNKFNEKLT